MCSGWAAAINIAQGAIKIVKSSDSHNVEVEGLLLQVQRFGRMLESANEGLCEIDDQGRCTFITASGARMLGYSVDSLVHSSFMI